MKRYLVSAMILALLIMLIWPTAQAQSPVKQIDDLTPPPPPASKIDDSDDRRIPETYLKATGGPDAFGYTYRDSDDEDCAYNWLEIAATGTDLGLNGDDVGMAFPVGFAFPFYGRDYHTVSASANGYLTFGAELADYVEKPFPNSAALIAVFWDDQEIERSHDEAIYYQRFISPDGDYLVVEFVVRDRLGSARYRYQAILYANGDIKLQYKEMGGHLDGSGTSASVGIGAGSSGLGYMYHLYPADHTIHDGLAVCIRYPDGIYLSPGWQGGYGHGGEVVSYSLLAVNQTGAPQELVLSVERALWPTVIRPSRLTLPHGETAEVTVEVTIPPGALGQVDSATVKATAVADPALSSNLAQVESTSVSGQYGYTGASTTNEAAIFDLGLWVLVDRLDLLPEGSYPYDATMKPDGSEVWIPGAVGDGVAVIDTATNQISQRITVGEYPISVAFRQDSAYAFVSNRDTEDVTVIDTSTYLVVGTIPIPTYYLGAGNMALNPCSGEIYLVDWYDDHFFVLDAEAFTVTQEVLLGDSLWQLVVSPAGDRLYLTDRGMDVVHVLDTATMLPVTAIPVDDDPWGIDITPDGTLLYVTNEDSHTLTVIDTTSNAVITTTGLPHDDADPRDVDISADGTYAYVTSGDVGYGTIHDEVYVIETTNHTVVGQIDIDPARNPNVVAVAPQMAGCGGLSAAKQATPDPVVLGDPLTYTIDYDYTGLSSTVGLVTDTLPVGTAYLTSSGGLSSTYDIIEHQVIWYLGTVPPGTADKLTATVLPIDQALAGQVITNQAYLVLFHITNFDFWNSFRRSCVSETATKTWETAQVRLQGDNVSPTFGNAASPKAPFRKSQGLLCEGALDFVQAGDVSVTVWAHSTVITPELSIRLPDGSDPPDPLLVCGGVVSLKAVSNRAGPLDYAWAFGDGTFGTGEVVTHTYPTVGTYTVLLTTTNPYGWIETDTLGVEVRLAPVAGFLSNSPVELGWPAVFTDTTANGPEAWFWDFGDGMGTSNQANPVYTYTSPGLYTVTLAVTNSCGADLSLDSFAVITTCQPVEGVLIDGPPSLEINQVGLYTATHTPPTATTPLTVTWDNGAVGSTAAYSWTAPGSYLLTATVTNLCGQASGTFAVEVYCWGVAEVAVNGPLTLGPGQVGLYTATYAPPTATTPVTLTWDNGAAGTTAVYSWTVPGSYTVTVTATNACGQASGFLVVEVHPVTLEYRIFLPLIVRNH